MTKREAKRKARYLAAMVLHSLMESGWPFEIQDGMDYEWLDADQTRIIEALGEMIERLMPLGEVDSDFGPECSGGAYKVGGKSL